MKTFVSMTGFVLAVLLFGSRQASADSYLFDFYVNGQTGTVFSQVPRTGGCDVIVCGLHTDESYTLEYLYDGDLGATGGETLTYLGGTIAGYIPGTLNSRSELGSDRVYEYTTDPSPTSLYTPYRISFSVDAPTATGVFQSPAIDFYDEFYTGRPGENGAVITELEYAGTLTVTWFEEKCIVGITAPSCTPTNPGTPGDPGTPTGPVTTSDPGIPSIPEPSSLMLLGTGMAGLAIVVWRREGPRDLHSNAHFPLRREATR